MTQPKSQPPLTPKSESSQPNTSKETPSFLNKLQNWWSTALVKTRSFLPDNLNQKLSDTALTTVIAVAAVVVVGIISTLLPAQSSKVADVSLDKPVPVANITTPPELIAPEALQPITSSPTVMTPEQNLIVSIKNKVAEISEQYADGLIQSIQPNFQGSSLVIKISDRWYNFDRAQQDKLASRMLTRAREFDFSRLEVTDPQGTLLARSPVVGNEMVILQRQIFGEQG